MDTNKDDVGCYEIPLYVPRPVALLSFDYVYLNIPNIVRRLSYMFKELDFEVQMPMLSGDGTAWKQY